MFYDSARKNDPGFIKWAQCVKARDKFSCQICGRNGDVHAHHKMSWDVYPETRYTVSNGVTLCSTCHTRFHEKYGYGNNTELQFIEFLLISKVFMKIIEGKNKKDDIKDAGRS
jgi:hypothetical protein